MQKDNWNVDHVEIVNTPPPALPHSGTDANLIKTSTSEGTTTLDQKDIEQLFKSRNLAFVSTLSKDGSPHITPVWADFEDDYILINTFETSAKNKNAMRDPRIAISVVEQNNPYNMVSIKGRVVEQTTEGADEHLKKLATRYLGIGKYYYRKPNHKRIILKIKPEKIMGLTIHPAFYFLAYSPWRK
ncbi:MAG: PPOX class F420-dependent oxidoreductase [Candidatus Nitrosocosmicus sp.]